MDDGRGLPQTRGEAVADRARRVVVTYAVLNLLFTLAASLIWAINTIFLLRVGGLGIFAVMIVNMSFTVAQMVFEIPTGVVADTIGRRASILLSVAFIMASTMMYVATPMLGWGIAGFIGASVGLGLGYTFQTGATDAWLVDALDECGWTGPKDRVFARGFTSASVGMLVGSLAGGILGQYDLSLPYLVRSALLAVCFTVAIVMVRDLGFKPRPLSVRTFGAEARHIAQAGVRYGWRSPVVRPLLWTSALTGIFGMYGFYAWQPYVLDLLGRDFVWLLGVVQATSSLATIAGNSLVGRVSASGVRRAPAGLLAGTTYVSAGIIVAIAAVGLLSRSPGIVPAGIAVVLWLVWSVIYGVTGPVRMAFINEHIPSAERATVLSVDAFFLDGGGAVGQPGLGYLSQAVSIPVAWMVGAVATAASAPLYTVAGRAAATETGPAESARPAEDPIGG